MAHGVLNADVVMRAAEFRQIRAYLQMSPRTLAQQLNVTPDAIDRWESGNETVPNLVALLMNALQRQKRERRRAS
jgi:DNA-binding transcriptional regulator YiaG